jgi:hypothetical protein
MIRRLPQIPTGAERLGRPTIMNRALAAKHGTVYVHLSAFAIDVDRVREAMESPDDGLPFGWEVFLTEIYLLERIPIADPLARTIVEDVVLDILERDGDRGELGAQLPFAVWDAVGRGAWPGDLRSLFASWKARPTELVHQLAQLWRDADGSRRALARACLDAGLVPPLAPTTVETLRAMVEK